MAEIPYPPPPKASTEPSPPTRINRQDLNSPNQTDGFYVELVSREDSAYQAEYPIKRGTPYANIQGADSRIVAQYASNPLYFLKQTADLLSMRVAYNGQYMNHVIWIWATNTLAQDTTNAQVDYMEEALTVPRYIRDSTIRRVDYDNTPTLTVKSALTCLLSVAITSPGTGYTFANGTIGSASAVAVCFAGAIIDWIVTVQGSGITSGAGLTVTGDGAGGAGTARIQLAGAVLVSQKKQELPEDDPRSHDYVKVIRVYEMLPGAVLTEYDQDEQTQVVVTTTYQVVVAPTSAPTATPGILISYRKIDSIKSLKITRDFTKFKEFSYDEQKFAADQFPALLDFSTYVFTDACGAFSQLRSSLSAKTQIRTHVTFTDTKQTFTGLVLLPISLMLGRGFQINQQVLVDDYTYTYTGTCTGTASGTGSDPTYTDYITNIQGTEQLVAGESVLFKGGLYRNTAVYEIMI